MSAEVQEVLLGAWISISEGRYRPRLTDDPRRALWVWLWGIAWRLASHYRGRAFRREEIAVADPWMAIPEPALDNDSVDRLDALEGFLAVFGLPPHLREVLLLAGIGHGPTEIAGILGLPVGTAASRLRRGRQLLVEKLVRGRTYRESPRG